MKNDLQSTLKATGYITAHQLQTDFGLTLSLIPWEPWMLWTEDALWDRDRYRKGSQTRHLSLVTSVYLRLAPVLSEWTLEGAQALAPRPDALFKTVDTSMTIALEADTGKETHAQWRDKLHAYETIHQDWHLLVVAQGKKLRLSRLKAWLTEHSPLAWTLIPYDTLGDDWVWDWTTPRLSLRITTPTPTPRITRYLLDGTVLSPTQREQLTATGQIRAGGRERRHLEDIHHYRHR